MANWFVALTVPADTWFARLPDPPPKVRRFSAADLHLTVAFLGDVTAQLAAAAFERARAFPRACLDITLGRVLPMGSARRFSALSAELLAGREEVALAIASVRDAVCDAAGARRDSRPVRPHVTLARPARNASRQELHSALLWAENLDLARAEVRLSSVALYTWSPERSLQLFQKVDSFTLEV